MRILVLGGGVVGVTTAYQLLQDGHDVALLERHPDVAQETSWGNAGMIAPGHSFVWSSPRAPWILLKSLFLKNQALRFRPSADPRLWSWSLRFLAECTAAKARANTLRKHRIAAYSQRVLHEVLAAEHLDYDRNARGIVYFYRDPAALEAGVAHMQLLAEDGQEIRVLDRAQLLQIEPSLAGAGDRIAGGIYCPTDETGDCNKFTTGLAAVCRGRGAEWHTGTTITDIEAAGDIVTGVHTDHGTFKADAYVMALGCQSPQLARRIGVALPVYPIKGYSLTIPIGNHKAPPTVGAVDEHNLVAISRFGDRVRVTATAEFAGYDTTHKPADFAFMKGVVQELYPDGADYERAEMWAGLRPMTPDNLPIVGRKRHRNLYYNTGHGHIGWTMSHGSARLAADVIAGRTPAIPVDGLA
ncbi:D-amino acid dehydrogenase [Limobrevibacterium gyesilva]|uniref:D-amino acid dehydrogenase n=1 Tax=Limobrevibacterium gyesilva TaxID=2991712 RepID=A0AA41YPY0_9PROT|nr:D-amino acid dehydrogenase [Limobrevibacterium gyesilva]MCW3476730.1 D-amino acid dehydrogenase [Limobrevibacterium gyesilva]